MAQDVVAPSVGESITEVSILSWHKQNGEAVKTGDILLEIESDKATVEVVAETDGVLQVLKQEGETVPIGEVLAKIDPAGAATAAPSAPAPEPVAPPPAPAAPAVAPPPAPAAPAQVAPPPAPPSPTTVSPPPPLPSSNPHLSPAAAKAVATTGVNPAGVPGTGKDGRVTKGDVLQAAQAPQPAAPAPAPAPSAPAAPQAAGNQDKPGDRRVKMSRMRTRIAERLVQAQRDAAILTTFNEVDLGSVIEIRTQYKEAFKAKHGVNLGFMSFFTKATIEALKAFPAVNASIDGGDIVYHDYYDVSIAVGTDRGLVVPVIRSADQMTFLEIEKTIVGMAEKARNGKLSIADMTGGTFTITNGGTYGSLVSTPILNPPQTGILGMHKIQERPMVINGQIMARPMMYIALSYDHRLIDGKEAVSFLVTLKDHLENPSKLGTDYTEGL